MGAPNEILDLISRFNEQRDSYRSSSYNEAQLRQEFVNPFFKSLGWDVDNTYGAAEAYKDVIHEDSIKIGDATKAPDYSFRIGGVRKFFVETKKPAVNIREDVAPAYQLRRFWTTSKIGGTNWPRTSPGITPSCSTTPTPNTTRAYSTFTGKRTAANRPTSGR